MKKENKIICPFCGKEYTGKMKTNFEFTGSGCDTCGYVEHTGSIKIYCEHCSKLVYQKDGIIID